MARPALDQSYTAPGSTNDTGFGPAGGLGGLQEPAEVGVGPSFAAAPGSCMTPRSAGKHLRHRSSSGTPHTPKVGNAAFKPHLSLNQSNLALRSLVAAPKT